MVWDLLGGNNMILIAHRGLTNGPDADLENRPEQICLSLSQGFNCEIDLHVINGEPWLGHNDPQYKIDHKFLEWDGLWIHAKNLDALYYLTHSRFNYFWHQSDDCVLTSQGHIWTYPEKPLTTKSIRLMPEWADPELKTVLSDNCYGICSDYVSRIRSIIPTDRIDWYI
jgi:hypothetical protein